MVKEALKLLLKTPYNLFYFWFFILVKVPLAFLLELCQQLDDCVKGLKK